MKIKKRAISLILTAAVILSLITTAFAYDAGENVFSSVQKIADNLTYTDTVSYSGSSRMESYMLESTPGGDAHPIVMACDTMYGGMTISRITDYAESLGYNVLGAINTDFFSSQRVPIGVVVEDGIYKCSPEGRTVVSFDNYGNATVSEKSSVSITLKNEGSALSGANVGKSVSLSHLNKYRVDSGGLYLYSEYFSTVSTRTSTDGWMVRFKVLDGGDLTVSGSLKLQVTELIEGTEAQPIGEDNLILTAAYAAGLSEHFKKFAVGDIVTLTTSCNDNLLPQADWATGGGDLLVSNGSVTSSSNWDSSLSGINPRSAIGIKPDGSVVYYVIDGRSSGYSSGLTMQQLAEEFQRMGCTYAVNFDGGGSSAMSVRLPGDSSCTTVNRPSDGSERRCGTYILLVSSSKPNGSSVNLSLKSDGAPILAGSTVNLSYISTDSGYMPVSVPSDITASSSGLGSLSGSEYTAGKAAGNDRIKLYSPSTGASGTGSLTIVNLLSSLTVKNASTGKEISSAVLQPGEKITLSLSGGYYMHNVLMSSDAVKFSVSGNIGTITKDGVFTASNSKGVSGTISVAAGGITKKISVSIPKYFTDTIGHWASKYIDSLYEKKIVNGTTDTTFSPNTSIKRGDFILMLYRAAGSPSVSSKYSFSDVSASKYYAKAISWAAAKNIATGTGDGKFQPEEPLTRQQAFAFVYRSLSALGISYKDGSVSLLSPFSDSGSLSSYAKTPAATLIKLGIVNGDGGKLSPNGSLTRAEMAKMLYCTLDLK